MKVHTIYYKYLEYKKIIGKEKMRNKSKDIAVTGFALFLIFFGAGNLLFSPYLSIVSRQSLMNLIRYLRKLEKELIR